MWIRQAPNGKFQFGENYKDPTTGKWKSATVTNVKNTAHTRKQAKLKIEAKIRDKLIKATDGIQEGVTLGQVIDEWLPYYEKQVKVNSYRLALNVVKRFRRDLGNDILLTTLTSSQLRHYFEGLMFNQGLKKTTINLYKAKMMQILDFAVDHHYVKSNVARGLKLSIPRSAYSTSIKNKFLDADELKQVLGTLYEIQPLYGRFCEFLYQTGMRFGEAASLQWSDFFEEDGQQYVHVGGTLIWAPDGQSYKQDSPKTDSSIRDVSLSDRAVEIINKERALHDGSKWVFQRDNGWPILRPACGKYLGQVKDRLGLDKPLTPHVFRHTHISKLAELGVPLYLIQQRVGHKRGEVTEAIYLHVTKKAARQLDQKLGLL